MSQAHRPGKKLMNRSFRWLAAGLLSILMSTPGHAQIEADECTNPAVAPTTPSTAFQPLGDGGEVLHRKTGLVWKRCGFGQTWDGQTCQGNPAGRNWNLALGVAANAGDSWRLPSVKELLTIVERCRHDPAINREVFPATRPAIYWSSSPYVPLDGGVLVVDFEHGRNTWSAKGLNFHVRLVRERP
jgi:hypothetical protein